MILKFVLGLCVLCSFGLVHAQDLSASNYAGPANHQPPPGHPGHPQIYFDWGRGQDGFGYCYEFNSYGQVLNGGRPVPNYNCERTRPSFVNWAQANNGFGYCFQFTPYHVVMNQGRPIANHLCERVQPSHYRWAQASDGWTYCFQFTPYGHAMNDGRPVPNHFCAR